MRRRALHAAARAGGALRMPHATRAVYGDAAAPRPDAFYDATVEQVSGVLFVCGGPQRKGYVRGAPVLTPPLFFTFPQYALQPVERLSLKQVS